MINANRIAISATPLHLQAVAIPILKDLGMSNLFSFSFMVFSLGRIARFYVKLSRPAFDRWNLSTVAQYLQLNSICDPVQFSIQPNGHLV
jgi:hypothetical protein